MAYVILGLLLIAPMSRYDLIKAFEAGVALFYSASSGSIKRALDSLLERDLIEVADVDSGGRGRKVYRATDAGRQDFHAWMTSPVTAFGAEGASLARLYFLGLVEESRRGTVLDRIESRMQAELDQLARLEERLETVVVPDELRDVATHQRATLDYGIASLTFAIGWFREHARASGHAGDDS